MNSLNLLSSRVSPSQSRTNTSGNIISTAVATDPGSTLTEEYTEEKEARVADEQEDGDADIVISEENTPLISKEGSQVQAHCSAPWRVVTHRFIDAITNSIRWVFTTLSIPGLLLAEYLYDDKGKLAPLAPIRRFWAFCFSGSRSASTAQALGIPSTKQRTGGSETNEASAACRSSAKISKSLGSSVSSSSESDTDNDSIMTEAEAPPSHITRSNSSHSHDEVTPARRSIRIRLHNEGNLRKYRHAPSSNTQSNGSGAVSASDVSPTNVKSPTSPAASLLLTKYPRAPTPPRPLIPRRQPSYTPPETPTGRQKTLIIDLDETLIHSMAKGGRMSTGHMVEVKLNYPTMGPQHPILYYVHKRPHCDDFLRKVYKWYNLVIFTASVQEYADPVIDWLEQERKFFSGRYYRQHCTVRQGAYIKDLSSVEPDLSKVIILDNSPLSYMFHQDNAIPIEGWISDPTDSDLLHLVPLLEGLQHVTDVRAFLALRGGEDGKHVSA